MKIKQSEAAVTIPHWHKGRSQAMGKGKEAEADRAEKINREEKQEEIVSKKRLKYFEVET